MTCTTNKSQCRFIVLGLNPEAATHWLEKYIWGTYQIDYYKTFNLQPHARRLHGGRATLSQLGKSLVDIQAYMWAWSVQVPPF